MFLTKWQRFVWISNGKASGAQIPFKIWTNWNPASFSPFKIQTSPDFRSPLCLLILFSLNFRAEILQGLSEFSHLIVFHWKCTNWKLRYSRNLKSKLCTCSVFRWSLRSLTMVKILVTKLLVCYLRDGLNKRTIHWTNCLGPFEYLTSLLFRSPL